MKKFLILLFAVSFFLPLRAHADVLLARWMPAERPESGPLGTGTGTLVCGMMEYRTLPNRHYIILGYVRACNGLFGSARSRAVTLAREHGADAILALSRATRSPGHFLLHGKPVESSLFVGAYAAIRFLQRKKEKPAWGIAEALLPLSSPAAVLPGERG
ncbi:hypothetical protein [Methylacidimicrobium sp. B4]|uniref:hypothetical protein n=1 Tax=Methylacidimicrobium sp. B4 TaxID=2796139 RepID=UPI001A8C14D4|nr:hypothetical protein [Methylacidimicrobium sp. B4]QSR84942.1 hypothetical protein MacB4_01315 [Methylacidimicrobium sp. B4]